MEKNARKGSLVLEPTDRWTTHDASELYDVASWGKGYFSVEPQWPRVGAPRQRPGARHRSEGTGRHAGAARHLAAHPDPLRRNPEAPPGRAARRVSRPPSREHNYKGNYCCVYPIKVNQQRQVVEEVLEFGRPYKFGLEAGSKPELLAVMAIADNETPIICNGFKDDEYIEMAMLAKKIGRQIIPVVEKYTELDLILQVCGASRRAAHHRHAREARQPRLGPLEVVGRLSLEVRTDSHAKLCARCRN